MKSREQHPHSFGGPKDDPRYKEPPLRISDDVVRYDHRAGNDHYKQAGDLFRLMKPEERAPDRQTRQLVVDNISRVASCKNLLETLFVASSENLLESIPGFGIISRFK
jgi:catalase